MSNKKGKRMKLRVGTFLRCNLKMSTGLKYFIILDCWKSWGSILGFFELLSKRILKYLQIFYMLRLTILSWFGSTTPGSSFWNSSSRIINNCFTCIFRKETEKSSHQDVYLFLRGPKAWIRFRNLRRWRLFSLKRYNLSQQATIRKKRRLPVSVRYSLSLPSSSSWHRDLRMVSESYLLSLR